MVVYGFLGNSYLSKRDSWKDTMHHNLKLSKKQNSHRLTLQTGLVHPLQTGGCWQDSHRLYTDPPSSPFLLSPPVSFKSRKVQTLYSPKESDSHGKGKQSNADTANKKPNIFIWKERKKWFCLYIATRKEKYNPLPYIFTKCCFGNGIKHVVLLWCSSRSIKLKVYESITSQSLSLSPI